MFRFIRKKVTLLGALAFSMAIAFYYYTKANDLYQVIIPSKSTYYTPGQKQNCKWLVHFTNEVNTETGDNSSAQIGIPEVIKDGYIAGIVQNGPGNSLLFAFKLPNQSENTPPVVMTAVYDPNKMPLKNIKFRFLNSTILSMTLYNSYESCVEATME